MKSKVEVNFDPKCQICLQKSVSSKVALGINQALGWSIWTILIFSNLTYYFRRYFSPILCLTPKRKKGCHNLLGKLFALHCTNHDRRKRRHWQKKTKFTGSKVNRAHWKIRCLIIQFLLELLIVLKRWHSGNF